MAHRKAAGLQQIGSLLREVHPELIISKRRLRKVESIECVRLRRENARQNLGFSSRPFVLCGLPVRRPPEGPLLYERRSGPFVLQVTGHPGYGLPWGQDRLVPIFLATQAIRQKSPQIVFESAAEMLSTFGMQQGGSQYRRLVASFQRIFGATVFFGTDSQSERAVVVHRARFNFMTEARIWYSRDPEQKLLPGDCQNRIVLSEEFYREIQAHPIPTDLEAAERSRRPLRPWICSCGFPTDASRPEERNACRCSALSAWSASLEASSMRVLASSGRSSKVG
jgi:hypothetical protein